MALTGVVAGGCVSAPGSVGSPETSASSSITPESSPTLASSQADADCGVNFMSVDYAPYTIPSIVKNGGTIVEAHVLSTEPAFYNTGDGKKPRGFPNAYGVVDAQPNGTIYTPVNVMVDRAFAGTVKPGALKVVVEGGTIGCYTLNVDTPGVIIPKSTYVFVLGDALTADGKTWKNQWQVKLAWPVGADGTVATSEGSMSLDALALEVSTGVRPTPTTPAANGP
jgi:hypothetical protein